MEGVQWGQGVLPWQQHRLTHPCSPCSMPHAPAPNSGRDLANEYTHDPSDNRTTTHSHTLGPKHHAFTTDPAHVYGTGIPQCNEDRPDVFVVPSGSVVLQHVAPATSARRLCPTLPGQRYWMREGLEQHNGPGQKNAG